MISNKRFKTFSLGLRAPQLSLAPIHSDIPSGIIYVIPSGVLHQPDNYLTWHVIWYLAWNALHTCHSFWFMSGTLNSIRHFFWYSIWHLYHSIRMSSGILSGIRNSFWHSFLAFSLAPVRVQARRAASRARDLAQVQWFPQYRRSGSRRQTQWGNTERCKKVDMRKDEWGRRCSTF